MFAASGKATTARTIARAIPTKCRNPMCRLRVRQLQKGIARTPRREMEPAHTTSAATALRFAGTEARDRMRSEMRLQKPARYDRESFKCSTLVYTAGAGVEQALRPQTQS